MGDPILPCYGWYDELKADKAVPSGTMQVARVFRDYGIPSDGKHVYVTIMALREETHAAKDTISRAINDLVQRGYLVPDAANANGRRAYYDLAVLGEVIHTRPSQQDATVPVAGKADRPSEQDATVPATRTEPSQPAGREPKNRNEPHPVARPERTAPGIDGATPVEMEWITRELKSRGARDAMAVLRAMDAGKVEVLLADARKATYTRPAWCGACDERTRLLTDLLDGTVQRCGCHPANAERTLPLRLVS